MIPRPRPEVVFPACQVCGCPDATYEYVVGAYLCSYCEVVATVTGRLETSPAVYAERVRRSAPAWHRAVGVLNGEVGDVA